MCAKVGQPAPDFTAQAVMPDNTFTDYTLSSLKGQYAILFFYPLDFTFVCPTEIIAFDKKLAEFKMRDCEVVGVSVDSHFSHLAWKNTELAEGGIGNIQYPLVSDLSHSISKTYGVYSEEDSVAFRGLFLIDREGIVRHALVNDLPLGRSINEALRTLDALRFVDQNGDQVCPANWREGEESMAPTASGVSEYLAASA